MIKKTMAAVLGILALAMSGLGGEPAYRAEGGKVFDVSVDGKVLIREIGGFIAMPSNLEIEKQIQHEKELKGEKIFEGVVPAGGGAFWLEFVKTIRTTPEGVLEITLNHRLYIYGNKRYLVSRVIFPESALAQGLETNGGEWFTKEDEWAGVDLSGLEREKVKFEAKRSVRIKTGDKRYLEVEWIGFLPEIEMVKEKDSVVLTARELPRSQSTRAGGRIQHELDMIRVSDVIIK